MLSSRVVCVNPPLQSLILSYTVPFANGFVMFRYEFFKKNNLFYSKSCFKFAEDYWLWVLFFNAGAKFGNVDEYLFFYRDFSESLSKVNDKKNKMDADKISKFFLKNNFKQIEKDINENRIDRLSSFESEALSNFLFRTVHLRPILKSKSLMLDIFTRLKVISFLKVFLG